MSIFLSIPFNLIAPNDKVECFIIIEFATGPIINGTFSHFAAASRREAKLMQSPTAV
jgi:hypothetical protein